ncbi:hypothetical protein RJ55_06958 [Drechmeria coniospora]|nr:hypothetical protein RJ55_06958 [Drechmeria coniospora]
MRARTAWQLLLLLETFAMAFVSTRTRCLMYLTGQHNVVPADPDLIADISHVLLAFMNSAVFNVDQTPTDWPLFTNVDEVRQKFPQGTKVMVAIGGWGDSKGFEEAAKDEASRARWARQVAAMIRHTGADGVDIDWEYPGGNRDDYKIIPNEKRRWEIEAFVQLLQDIRSAIGTDKLLSVAVPGLERDLMAYTPETVPRISQAVDFINVMAYDLMNRRDTVVKHHSGVADTRDALQRYVQGGAPPRMLNLGLGYYVKAFMTQECGPDPIGCPTQLLEDPKTGADLGRTAGFSWHDETSKELVQSFRRALDDGFYDDDGSYGYWDGQEKRWWTFDTPPVIERKLHQVLAPMGYGGVFAWGLGEDAPKFANLAATINALRAVQSNMTKDEL